MKKAILTLMCMAAMMMAGTSLKAQEITIVLNPGWTWISCPSTDTLDFTTAFGSFTPAIGDIIKSKWGAATYTADGQWRGSVSLFYPGYGYHYKSNRTEPVIVTFNAQQPAPQVVVTTLEPADITTISTIVGGTVTLNEGNHVYACGVCWDTVQMPTVNGNHTSNDANACAFTDTLTELTPNTTYYVRAYVVTDYGLAYGGEQSFTTLDNSSNVPEGAINGLFTINANGDQVYFSQGNLQYQASTNTWRFAINQYDCIGYDNSNISSTYSGWIDLFGWGTSGYHDANDPYNVNYQPWSTSTATVNANYNYYGYGPSTNMTAPNLTGTSANYDWGVYNPISNGGNTTNQWRVLSFNEWNYIIYFRNTTSGFRFAKAQINNVNGFLLLPDNWNPSTFDLNYTNYYGNSGNYSDNTLDPSQWSILENAGVIFLPVAGVRYNTTVSKVDSYLVYWTSNYVSHNKAYWLSYEQDDPNNNMFGAKNTGYSYRAKGCCVRLVQDR